MKQKHIISLFLIFGCLYSNAQIETTPEKSKYLDIGFIYKLTDGYMASASYYMPINNNLIFEVNLEGGQFNKITCTEGIRSMTQKYYNISLTPEIKYYPLKKNNSPFGFYLSAYSSLHLIQNNGEYFNNSVNINNDQRYGTIVWPLGVGTGYKINVYNGLYIEPMLGFSIPVISNEIKKGFDYCGEGFSAISFLFRNQVRVGYCF